MNTELLSFSCTTRRPLHPLRRFPTLQRGTLSRWPAAFGAAAVAVACSGTEPEGGVTYRVGPGEEYTELRDVAHRLQPGDIVEVSGGSVYAGGVTFAKDGAPGAEIIVRGVRSEAGARPVLQGGEDTVYLGGSHFVLEGFEITGGSFRCIYHQADQVVVRDTWIHDCAGHGILGADTGSGSLTLEGVEVSASGEGDTLHPIYAATDEVLYPGARFRMTQSYVHDNRGGNGVKSRAQRNELYYNWIEGSAFYELDLIGPEEVDEYLAREDSDIVGNVLLKRVDGGVMRVGGDGSGQSFGRYRFVQNTVLLSQQAYGVPIHLVGGVESLEVHGNVIHRPGGGDEWSLVVDDEVKWTSGPAIAATRNWVSSGAVVPAAWTETVLGDDPGFVDEAAGDLRPRADSPVIDAGGQGPGLGADLRVPAPLEIPAFVPPRRTVSLPGHARQPSGNLDVGAFELE